MLKKLLSFLLALGLLLAAIPGSAAAASGFTYVARKGDTYTALSALYGVSIERLLSANGIQRNAEPLSSKRFWLTPGQEVVIPIDLGTTPSRVNPFNYTVKLGDTLGLLSVQFEISTAVVAKANNLDANALTKLLLPGQTLLIPAGPHSWKLEPGESLSDVAALYGVTEAYLLKVNGVQKEGEFVGKTLTIPIQYNRPFTPMMAAPATQDESDGSQPSFVAAPALPDVAGPLTFRWIGQTTNFKPVGAGRSVATFTAEFRGGEAPFRLYIVNWGKFVDARGPFVKTDNNEKWADLDFDVNAGCGEKFLLQVEIHSSDGQKAYSIREFVADCK